jgi:acyl dehydratase
MERARHFEDYVVGEKRSTFARTITDADFVIHAGHTGDFFPHHMDAETMKSSPWGQRIAHGTMTFAVGIGLTAGEINPLAFTYGYERLRFPKPVFIGDTIHTELTISKLEDDPKRVDHGRITEAVRVINQRNEVVLACEHIYLAKRRGSPIVS